MDWLRDANGNLGGDTLQAWQAMDLEGVCLLRLQLNQRTAVGEPKLAAAQLVLSEAQCRELAKGLLEIAERIGGAGGRA